jgi:hypothetical protein
MPPASDPHSAWPATVPEDLRRRLEGVMGYRAFGPAEVWDAVREWLIAEGINTPFTQPSNGPESGP